MITMEKPLYYWLAQSIILLANLSQLNHEFRLPDKE